MATRPHRLPPEDAPLTFAPQAPAPWDGWMVALEEAAKSGLPPPLPPVVPAKVGDASRLLDRWLVLVERAPRQTPVAWWRQALAHAGHWCPGSHPWPGARIVQAGRSEHARFLAAWIAQAPQSAVGLHWPRQAWNDLPGATDDKTAWADQLLEHLEAALITEVRNAASGSGFVCHLGPWVEAAGALQARLEMWGLSENSQWSVRRGQNNRAVAVFLPEIQVQTPLDTELWGAWSHPHTDRALYRTTGPITKKAWCGTVEVLVRLGARLLPLLKSEVDVDRWWTSVRQELLDRHSRAPEFPHPDTAWAEWTSVKVNNWEARAQQWKLALRLDETMGPAQAGPGGRKRRL